MELGKYELVLSAVNQRLDELEKLLVEHFSDFVEVTGRTKNDLIVRLVSEAGRMQLLQRLSSVDNLEIEHFETYKPSLNDIFVAKVGEEE